MVSHDNIVPLTATGCEPKHLSPFAPLLATVSQYLFLGCLLAPVAAGDATESSRILTADGVELETRLTLDWSATRNAEGATHGGAVRGLVELGTTFDLQQLGGSPAASIFIGLQSFQGRDDSARLGAVQSYSDIDTPSFSGLGEMWYEQRWSADRLRLKAGRVDANTEFAVIESADPFLLASAGASPALVSLPTYPEPREGVNLFYRPAANAYVGVGLYRGAAGSDERFAILESGASWSDRTRLAIGGWRDAGPGDGLYLILEQRVAGRPAPGKPREVRFFSQIASGDPEVSEIASHVNVGLLLRAPLPGRPEDSAGLLLSHVELSGATSGGDPDETTFELFYRVRLSPFLDLQPDLQYVRRPGGNPGRHAWAATLRIVTRF